MSRTRPPPLRAVTGGKVPKKPLAAKAARRPVAAKTVPRRVATKTARKTTTAVSRNQPIVAPRARRRYKPSSTLLHTFITYRL
jgi:hypothetical protein